VELARRRILLTSSRPCAGQPAWPSLSLDASELPWSCAVARSRSRSSCWSGGS
ncbi:unnamed protein product, partial [Polarella glacialis]